MSRAVDADKILGLRHVKAKPFSSPGSWSETYRDRFPTEKAKESNGLEDFRQEDNQDQDLDTHLQANEQNQPVARPIRHAKSFVKCGGSGVTLHRPSREVDSLLDQLRSDGVRDGEFPNSRISQHSTTAPLQLQATKENPESLNMDLV